MPTEILAIIYLQYQSLTLGRKIPSFSDLSSWRQEQCGLGQSGQTLVACTTNEVVYDPHSARKFDLYYIVEGRTTLGPEVITVTIPINGSDPNDDGCAGKPDKLPAFNQKSTYIGNQGWDIGTLLSQKAISQ